MWVGGAFHVLNVNFWVRNAHTTHSDYQPVWGLLRLVPIVALWLVFYAEQKKFTAGTGLFLTLIMWVNNYKTPKILAAFITRVNNIARGSNRGGGWRVNWYKMEYEDD